MELVNKARARRLIALETRRQKLAEPTKSASRPKLAYGILNNGTVIWHGDWALHTARPNNIDDKPTQRAAAETTSRPVRTSQLLPLPRRIVYTPSVLQAVA